MIAIILAGGIGKRLHDLSRKISKAMMPVLGIPITARIMGQICSETPLRRFIVVVRRPDQDIAVYFRKNPPRSAEVEFVVQPESLGMANALKKVSEQAEVKSDFLLAACDNLFQEGAVSEVYSAFQRGSFDGVMCLLRMRKEEIAGKSAAVYLKSGRISRIVEKPSLDEIETGLASIPLYAFGPKLMGYIPLVKPSKRGEYELQDAVQMLIDDDGKIGYTVTNWRRQVTAPEDLLAINLEMLRKERGQTGLQIPGVEIEQPVMVGERCVFSQDSRVGPNVYIGEGSTIGRDCRLSNCVVLPNSRVPDGTRANHQLLW